MAAEIIRDLHNTPETGLIAENYPYGRYRTQIRYWVETKNKRQRFGSQTLNPKTKQWNHPKYGIYEDLVILYRNTENGHIEHYTFEWQYSEENELNKLLAFLGDYRNEHIDYVLKLTAAVFETRKSFKVVIKPQRFKHKITGEITETINLMEINYYEKIEEEDDENTAKPGEIAKLLAVNAKKQGLTLSDLAPLGIRAKKQEG